MREREREANNNDEEKSKNSWGILGFPAHKTRFTRFKFSIRWAKAPTAVAFRPPWWGGFNQHNEPGSFWTRWCLRWGAHLIQGPVSPKTWKFNGWRSMCDENFQVVNCTLHPKKQLVSMSAVGNFGPLESFALPTPPGSEKQHVWECKQHWWYGKNEALSPSIPR